MGLASVTLCSALWYPRDFRGFKLGGYFILQPSVVGLLSKAPKIWHTSYVIWVYTLTDYFMGSPHLYILSTVNTLEHYIILVRWSKLGDFLSWYGNSCNSSSWIKEQLTIEGLPQNPKPQIQTVTSGYENNICGLGLG